MNKVIVLLGLIWSQVSLAQNTNRYFVFFTQKGGEEYPYTLENPGEYLSLRSIERRTNQDVLLDSTDLPVNPAFLQRLSGSGIDVFFSSKWLNGALVQATDNQESLIKSFDFVDSIRLVANGSRLGFDQHTVQAPTEFLPPTANNGDTDVQLSMLGADLMLADDLKGQNMMIAVLDNGFTGVNKYTPFQHLWEDGRIIASKDFVENSGNVFQYGSHGTSVFSIIGAFFETDTTTFHGVAYGADFVLCVTEDDEAENTIEEYNWILGAEFSDSLGVDVINSSLGYRTFDIDAHDYEFEDLDGTTSVITRAATMAASKGIIVVTSAGNSGRRSPPRSLISHPADADSILAVGSVDPDFYKSDFSSVGPTEDGRIKPDVTAFGNGTALIRGSGVIERGGGTSFASPLIAGFAAGIWQANPSWTSQEVIQAIKNSSHRIHTPDSLVGYGVPNYVYAVEGETKSLNVEDILEEKFTVYPNPFQGNKLYLKVEGDRPRKMDIRILGPNGSLIYNQKLKSSQITEQIEISVDSTAQGVYYLFLQTESNHKVVKLINF